MHLHLLNNTSYITIDNQCRFSCGNWNKIVLSAECSFRINRTWSKCWSDWAENKGVTGDGLESKVEFRTSTVKLYVAELIVLEAITDGREESLKKVVFAHFGPPFHKKNNLKVEFEKYVNRIFSLYLPWLLFMIVTKWVTSLF